MGWSRWYVLSPGNVIFAGIALFFLLFLGFISARNIVRPMLRPTPEEARSEMWRNARPLHVALTLLALFSPFLATAGWLHFRPALFTVQRSGEWVVRNAFLVPLRRVPPERPRTLEADLEHGVDTDGTPFEHIFSGSIRIAFPFDPGEPDLLLEAQAMGDDSEGRPEIFLDLALDRLCAAAPETPGRFATPPFRVTPDGPLPVPSANPVHP